MAVLAEPLALAIWEVARGAPNGARTWYARDHGGRTRRRTARRGHRTPVKALAPFGAGVLLDVVLDAVAAAGIAGIAVVGDPVVGRRLPAGVRLIPAAPDGATNVGRALDACPTMTCSSRRAICRS